MPTYFDSSKPAGGNGSTPELARNTFAGFTITNTDANTRDIKIASGSVFNMSNSIVNADGYTTGKITIAKYGAGANPFIYATSNFAAHNLWIRCTLAGIQAGNVVDALSADSSRLWYRSGKTTSLLFGDADTGNANATHWAQLRKIPSAPTEGNWPDADYQIAEVYITKRNGSSITPETGTLVYASKTKDPIDYYGVTYSNTPTALFEISSPRGGFEFSGVDFGPGTQLALDIKLLSYNALCAPVILRDFRMDRSLGMRISSSATNRTNTIGINGLLIEDIIAKNIGNAFLGNWATPYNASHVLNNAIIRHNVVAGVCERFSVGGIYLLQCRTNNGSKIQVYENTVSGAKRDRVWPDGYAIYMDYSCEDYDVYRNYVWDCDLAYRNNGTTGTGIVRENVAIASATAASNSSAFGSNDPNKVDEAANITYSYNVSVGFNKFMGFQDVVSGSTFNIHHNVSVARVVTPTPPYALDSRSAVGMTLVSNNFYGYATHWADTFAPTGDLSGSAMDKISTNPTTALTTGGVVLNPTDKEFNYALSLPNMVWSGTPSYGGVAPRVASGANTVAAITSAGTSIAISNATSSKTTDAVTSTGTGTVSISAVGSNTINEVASTGTAAVSVYASGGNEVEVLSYCEAVLLGDSFSGTTTVEDVISEGAVTVDIVASGANTTMVFSDSATSLIVVSIVASGESTTSVSSAGTAKCETLCSGASTVDDTVSDGYVDVESAFHGANTIDVASSGEVIAYTAALSNAVLDDVFSVGEVSASINVVGANTVDDITAYESLIDELLRWKHSTTRRHTPWVTQ